MEPSRITEGAIAKLARERDAALTAADAMHFNMQAPRREFWERAFCHAVDYIAVNRSCMQPELSTRNFLDMAGEAADAALAEWDKRWGAQ